MIKKPTLGVSALIQRRGKYLLVQRGHQPNAGQLAFPGGKVEWGETLKEAVERELLEETGITATAECLIDAVNVFVPEKGSRMAAHYVVLCYLCHWQHGQGVAQDDAGAIHWLTEEEILQRTDISPGVQHIINQRKANP